MCAHVTNDVQISKHDTHLGCMLGVRLVHCMLSYVSPRSSRDFNNELDMYISSMPTDLEPAHTTMYMKAGNDNAV